MGDSIQGEIDRRGRPQPPQPDPPAPPAPSIPSTPGRLTKIDGPFHPRLYAYWANAVVIGEATYVFAARVYQRPEFYRINADGSVTPLGNLANQDSESEGWHWDRDGWLYLPYGRTLQRTNPFAGVVIVAMAVADGQVSQSHSSEDGQVHSATVGNGTVVNYRGQYLDFPAQGALDESIVTTDGEFLLIQEDRYNRVITLATREEWRIEQEQGAVGHCDAGDGFVVGEDDHHGACVLWDLRTRTRRELFKTWGMGHVSVRGRRALVSNATDKHLALMDLDSGAYTVLPVGPFPSWGTGDTPDERYNRQIRANLSPCGTRACWTYGDDLFVLEL